MEEEIEILSLPGSLAGTISKLERKAGTLGLAATDTEALLSKHNKDMEGSWDPWLCMRP